MRMRPLSCGRPVSRRHFLSHASLNAGLASIYLSKAAVKMLTGNQLTPEQRATDHARFVLGNTAGWGLGGSVELGNSPLGFPAGAFGWNGGYGTTAYIDPASDTAGV